MTTESVWMTAGTRERLERELAELELRTLATSSDQVRRTELKEMLRRSEVDRKPDDGLVEPGMKVTVRFDHDGSTTTFLLGHRELTHLDGDIDVEVYSPTSPLGVAITGRYVGDSVTFTGPTRQQRVSIVSAVPFG